MLGKIRIIIMIILLIGFGALFFGLLDIGMTTEKEKLPIFTSGYNKKCLLCHDLQNAQKRKAPAVDTRLLAAQVHKDLSCVDCHSEAIEQTDENKEKPHGQGFGRVTCNTVCHAENGPSAYNDSIHGRLARELNDEDVAKCQDCHGTHDIVKCSDPESKVARCNLCQGCAKCHENQEIVFKHHIHKEHPCLQWELSVHGTPRVIDGKLTIPAVCTDCHGVHDIQGVGADALSARQAETCGKCHSKELEDYLASIHGISAVANKNPDAPLCVDCHGEHNIMTPASAKSTVYPSRVPETCAGCHARSELMKKYGISPDRVATFINSFHGIAISFNEKAVATCTSCHGHHLVLPAKDPRSSVNPTNLHKTCGKPECHPKMPRKIRDAKIHVDYSSPASGVVYWVRRILIWTLIILLVVSVIWVVPDILHRIRLERLKKKGDVPRKP